MVFNFQDGETLLIDKAAGWSSFDVVRKVRNLITRTIGKRVKVGHAGTLDPLATGLIILATGRSTKKINQIQALDKEYTATIQLGATTPSYDLETEVENTFPTEHIPLGLIKNNMQNLIGTFRQIPPPFCAKKIQGERAYYKARRGETVNFTPTPVEIYEFELLSDENRLPKIHTRIVCSKGTYIRSLAHTLGQRLNNGAFLSALRRTRIGAYHVNDAITIKQFEEKIQAMQ